MKVKIDVLRVYELMAQKGYTRKSLAAESGLSYQTIDRLEKGYKNLSTAAILADVLGTNIQDITQNK